MLDSTRSFGIPDRSHPSQTIWQRVVRRICTSNPFYALSCVLVLLGLRLSCDPDGAIFPTWALLLGLGSYTLLLAFTACGLVRFLGVWDDVRTILLLVVIVLTAIPAFFDDILVRNPQLGISCELGGLAFAVLVSELVLRGTRLRLPIGFRLPYYFLISLFFLHPVALVPFLRNSASPAIPWLLFGFPSLAGLALLTLLPAVRRGASYVQGNGSPWRWPLYPWSLFVILGLAVVTRSYSICLSVNYSEGSGAYQSAYSTIFGPYFLIPALLATAFLVMESGIVTGNRRTQAIAMCFPPGLVLLAAIGRQSDASYMRFLQLFTEDLGGSPLFLTIGLATVFYAIAIIRRVRWATEALTACMATTIVIGPESLDFTSLVEPRPIALVLLAAVQLAFAIRRGVAWRALFATVCLAIACDIEKSSASSPTFRAILASHVLLAGCLAIGISFNDAWSRFLRKASAVLLAGMTVFALLATPPSSISPELVRMYPALALLFAAACGMYFRESTFFAAAGTTLTIWVCTWGWQFYARARRQVVGLDHIAFGLMFFAVAATISLWKGGAFEGMSISRGKRGMDPLKRPHESLIEIDPIDLV